MNKDKLLELPQQILKEVSKAVIGKEELKEALLIALIAGGHILIEGLPGTAKTKLANAFAQAIGGSFKRIQLTPDMMPADIIGFYLYTPEGSARLIRGPIFANIVLADELNRTTPRTQAALLEAMGERQVTIEGTTYPLSSPFMVIATQMGAGAEGTYPLTDVQQDRFMLRVVSLYPSREEEREVIRHIDYIDEPDIGQVATGSQIEELQRLAEEVYVGEEVIEYILDLVGALRRDPDVAVGPSPRGSIWLFKGARAKALLEGRDFVIPDDVKFLAPLSLTHRIKLKPEAEMEGITPQSLVEKALSQTPVPKL